MLFSSIPFLYYFLPCVLLLYFLSPKPLKNLTLLVFSLVFYAWGEPKFVVIMLISLAVGYVSGLLLEKYRDSKWGKVIVGVSVAIPLVFLAYFKYADFFITNFNLATGLSVPLLKVTLPIGISFYTFQIISYQVDVFRGSKSQKNPINLATFIALFPQLIAGPIVRYTDIEKELENRTHSVGLVSEGAVRFCVGLAKKIVIANTLGALSGKLGTTSVLSVWLCAIAVSLQIYFDFSGYSDMAIGLGKIFGFHFLENFNYPFISRSVTEFWRRWHMSLGTWFRDYVYIPMGGNRCKKPRWFFNIATVWFLTGFWHGADWNFIIWGVFFAIFLIAEKLFLGEFLNKHRIISHVYVILLTLISFTIFNTTDLLALGKTLTAMVGVGVPLICKSSLYYLESYAVILVIACIGSTPLMKKLVSKLPEKVSFALQPVYLIGVFTVCTAFLVDGSFNPFLYFRF